MKWMYRYERIRNELVFGLGSQLGHTFIQTGSSLQAAPAAAAWPFLPLAILLRIGRMRDGGPGCQ